jgi:hypothetical protein
LLDRDAVAARGLTGMSGDAEHGEDGEGGCRNQV